MPVQGEILLEASPAALAERTTPRGVIHEGSERLAERVWVLGDCQETGLSVDDRLRDAAHIARDHGEPRPHGLEDAEGKSLALRGQDEDVRAGEPRCDVALLAVERDAVLEAEVSDLGLNPGAQGTVPDEISTRPYVRGALGMPKSVKDDGGCQLFFMHTRYQPLDERYTNYGTVVEGMETVDAIRVGDRILKATVREGN